MDTEHSTIDKVSEGLINLYKIHNGLVIGGNDFLYTNQLDEHPCSYFVYTYGFLLSALGVDTIFLENHYINEPIQTRGFIGSIMYCAYLYGLRVIGIELKGSPSFYYEHTGKQVDGNQTTVAYDEESRLKRLNMISKDIVEWKMAQPYPEKRKGKWILFCGMSHVNDEKHCKGIRTLLNVPGLGILFGKTNMFTKEKMFKDPDSSYKKPTDYLIEIERNIMRSARFHVDTTLFGMMYKCLFFFNAYQKMMKEFGIEVTVGDLWTSISKQLYPKRMRDMIEHIIKADPYVNNKEHHHIGSIVFGKLKEVCSRKMLQSSLAGMTKIHMNELVDHLILFIEEKTKSSFQPIHYPYFMDMLFLERKTMPTEEKPINFISAVKRKFQKQLTRPENHIYSLLFIMNSLHISIPQTRFIHLLFPSSIAQEKKSQDLRQ